MTAAKIAGVPAIAEGTVHEMGPLPITDGLHEGFPGLVGLKTHETEPVGDGAPAGPVTLAVNFSGWPTIGFEGDCVNGAIVGTNLGTTTDPTPLAAP